MIRQDTSRLGLAVENLFHVKTYAERAIVNRTSTGTRAAIEEVELTVLPQLGSKDNGAVTYSLTFTAGSDGFEFDIQIVSIYRRDPNIEISQDVLWEFFARVVLRQIYALAYRIRDSIIPIMFAQLDFIPDIAEIEQNLLETSYRTSPIA
ncbi:hypothetical protein ACTOVL_05895 [Arcanobacterium canis]